ncbi:putative nuclease HARBI1 [Ischnura elegans]|uniref:putative nuclease HARBI1 n=1 Tax=Ischnura elegans TaxID=197161 RepID=UPI001ED89216|nr:putative nuclease HARBI1 [Ischnura elegans]
MVDVQQRSKVWLLGDSGYRLEPWLLTPVLGMVMPNSPEDRYNRALRRARNTVERCIGLLKSRWRCLLKHRVLHYMPNKASRIINACAVLHNMCLDRNVQLEEEVEEEIEVEEGPQPNIEGDQREGRVVRNRVIATHFS